MQDAEFFAAGVPKGQPRPRAFSRNGHARVFDPGTAEGWKSAVAVAAAELVGRFVSGPLRVRIELLMPRPKTHRRKDGSVKSGAPIHHEGKPDVDNAAKAILDALTTIGVWRDDAQVVCLSVRKRYADGASGAVVCVGEEGE